MKYLLSIVFACTFSVLIFAQSSNFSQPFVYLFDGSLITVDSLSFKSKTGIFGQNYILADGQSYKVNQVKFYSTGSSYHANASKLGSSGFVTRLSAGKINSYSLNYSLPAGSGGKRSGGKINLYNVGFGNLKRVNYSNLKYDLAGNPDAMLYINKYKRSRNIRNILLVGGLATAVTGIFRYSINDEPQIALGIVGSTALLTGLYLNIEQNLYKAIDVHNGFKTKWY